MTQLPTSGMKKANVITDTADIKRILRKYYEQFYTHKLKNLVEMEQFFEKHKLPRSSIGTR